ncbi:hypothetical protein GCM10028824_39300 [Hymenobacter segetis]|uniref:CBM-cenC domain-containing protein n=1 Tax=Hymenobacter segetis TaxID=2025509 RepID=A0ABU9M2N8_9BACT
MPFFYRISTLLHRRHRLLQTTLAVALAATLGGCRPAPEEPGFILDFENLSGWQPEGTPWLTTVRARSGQHACLADANSEFTAHYTTSAGQLGMPRRVRLGAWVWLPSNRLKAGIILQVKHGSEQRFWGVLPVTSPRRIQQWEHAQCDLILPDDIEPGDEVSLSVWQTSITREDFYVDDISIEKIR